MYFNMGIYTVKMSAETDIYRFISKKLLTNVYNPCYIVYCNKVLTNEWGDPLIFVDTGK